MAYENQIKCMDCGISIPSMPEDAGQEELLCDRCSRKGDSRNPLLNSWTVTNSGFFVIEEGTEKLIADCSPRANSYDLEDCRVHAKLIAMTPALVSLLKEVAVIWPYNETSSLLREIKRTISDIENL